MDKITLKELPIILTDEIVKVLRKMENSQTNDWKEIFRNWSNEQEDQYYTAKSRLEKIERAQEWQNMTQKDKKNYIATRIRYYANHHTEITFDQYVPELVAKREKNSITNKEIFHYFWETSSVFSQWHPSPFVEKTWIFGYFENQMDFLEGHFPYGEQEYSSAEQFMMYHKAMLFMDFDTAHKIMATKDVRKIKEFGRQVQNFNDTVWAFYRTHIVWNGNYAKFEQNETLRQALLDTQGKTLVEASPYDTIWGIGLKEDDPLALDRSTWRGKNLLGELLTEIRVKMMGHY